MTNHPNRSKPAFYKNLKGVERCELVAEAFYLVARANHYMVGICDPKITRDECDAAEQILIALKYPDQPRNVRKIAGYALQLLGDYRYSLPS